MRWFLLRLILIVRGVDAQSITSGGLSALSLVLDRDYVPAFVRAAPHVTDAFRNLLILVLDLSSFQRRILYPSSRPF